VSVIAVCPSLNDAIADERLRSAGWEVLRVWEHDDVSASARRINDVVARRNAGIMRWRTQKGLAAPRTARR
jgi:hypothetical protein